MTAVQTNSHDKFTRGQNGFAIYQNAVSPITAVSVTDGFVYAAFNETPYGHATLQDTDCFLDENTARQCLANRIAQTVNQYKAEITDMYSLLQFALNHVIAGEDTDEPARQAFLEKAAALGYSMTKAKPAQPAVNDYPSDICATCGNRAKTPGYIGPNCLACKHSYFEGSEAYEYKRDYYVPETEENNK